MYHVGNWWDLRETSTKKWKTPCIALFIEGSLPIRITPHEMMEVLEVDKILWCSSKLMGFIYFHGEKSFLTFGLFLAIAEQSCPSCPIQKQVEKVGGCYEAKWWRIALYFVPYIFVQTCNVKNTVKQKENLIIKVRQMLLLNGTTKCGEFDCFFHTLFPQREQDGPEN